MANDNLKKPESDSKVPLTQEEKDKRKKIIILIGLIILVLAILIGTAYYFSSKEKDNDDGKDKNPGNVVKPIEKDDDTKKPEPVVDNNTNNVIVYRPVKRPEPVIPPVQETPTTITGSEEDSLISIDFDEETNTINVSGTSKYVAKVNENFGSGFNNIVQVKITLNSKYKREDIKDITVTTDVTNGKKNYFLDDVQEDEDGNLYFYWLQAVGKTLDLMPKLTINYGDGMLEEYVMDLSNISIQTPLENGADLAQALVSTDGNKVVVGGIELNLDYKLTILEEVPVKTDEETKDDGTSLASAEIQDENQSTQNPANVTDPSNLDSTNPSDEVKEATDKDYILKVTGIDELDAYTEEAAIKLGFKGYKYIIAVKLYAPEGFKNTQENISKIVFEKSHVDEEGTTLENITSSQSTLKLLKEGDRYYIIVMMAVDGVYPGNNPYVSIDWDGDGNEHGTSRYIFDFSEFNYVDPEVPETPTNPENPPIQTEGDGNSGTQDSEDLDTSNQSGSVSGNGDVTNDDETLNEDEEKLTVLSDDADDNQDKEDEALDEDATPNEETDTQDGDITPDGNENVASNNPVPSGENIGSNALEANQNIENN